MSKLPVKIQNLLYFMLNAACGSVLSQRPGNENVRLEGL